MNDYVIAGGLEGPWKKVRTSKLAPSEIVTVHADMSGETFSNITATFAEVAAAVKAGKTVRLAVDFSFEDGEHVMHYAESMLYNTGSRKTAEGDITAVIFANTSIWSISDSEPSFNGVIYDSEGLAPIDFELAVSED